MSASSVEHAKVEAIRCLSFRLSELRTAEEVFRVSGFLSIMVEGRRE